MTVTVTVTVTWNTFDMLVQAFEQGVGWVQICEKGTVMTVTPVSTAQHCTALHCTALTVTVTVTVTWNTFDMLVQAFEQGVGLTSIVAYKVLWSLYKMWELFHAELFPKMTFYVKAWWLWRSFLCLYLVLEGDIELGVSPARFVMNPGPKCMIWSLTAPHITINYTV